MDSFEVIMKKLLIEMNGKLGAVQAEVKNISNKQDDTNSRLDNMKRDIKKNTSWRQKASGAIIIISLICTAVKLTVWEWFKTK